MTRGPDTAGAVSIFARKISLEHIQPLETAGDLVKTPGPYDVIPTATKRENQGTPNWTVSAGPGPIGVPQ